MLRGSVTASLIGNVLLLHVKELGQLLIGLSSLLEKISRGLYYERMKLSYLCTAEYIRLYFRLGLYLLSPIRKIYSLLNVKLFVCMYVFMYVCM